MQSKMRRKSSSKDVVMATPSPRASPALRSKRSAADLIFEMDDEDDEEDDDRTVSPLPSLTDRLQAVAISGASTPVKNVQPNSWRLDQQPEPSPFDRRTLDRPSPQPSESTSSPSGHSRPWGAAPLASSKLGLQEIMSQASSTRTSNIALGLSAVTASERKTSGSFKPSQKERKKQQIQQGAKSAPTIVQATEPSSISASPWQIAKPKSASRVSTDVLPTSQSPIIASPRTPHLTMRQTVANPSSSAKQKIAIGPSTPVQRSQTRKASTSTSYPSPATSQPSSSSKRPTSSSKAKALPTASLGLSTSDKPVPIQSIRHIPQQTSSYTEEVHLTMEEILSQQLIEKTVIKDFAAKRSLQEIQQEQEFQEWWDKESARVREEEELAAKGPSGRGEKKDVVSSGRGGRGGKRRGRGGAAVAGGRMKGRPKAESSSNDGPASTEK
jgi:hypothetical protein